MAKTKKRKLLLKSILNGHELFDAIFLYVIDKYRGKKRIRESLESGREKFLTYIEMPMTEDNLKRQFIDKVIVEIYEPTDN